MFVNEAALTYYYCPRSLVREYKMKIGQEFLDIQSNLPVLSKKTSKSVKKDHRDAPYLE